MIRIAAAFDLLDANALGHAFFLDPRGERQWIRRKSTP
jgi:hypothetical protein